MTSRVLGSWYFSGLAIAVGLAVGCSENGDGGTDCVPASQAIPGIGSRGHALTCPPELCGSNSAEINDIPIGEFHITPGQNTGQVNQWGARMVGFIAPDGSTDYVLGYSDGVFFASNGTTELRNEQLVGSRFLVEDTNTCNVFEMLLDRHDQVLSWTTPAYPVNRYVFVAENPELGMVVPICTSADDPDKESAWAVLVGGERYSWEDKDISATGDQALGWFNLACEGNALYKMKLAGYDPQPNPGNENPTTPEQRDATLKMMTADYCGGGTSYTETGTDLYWHNAAGWSENSGTLDMEFEAYWNGSGALCLDTPRLGVDLLADVLDECDSLGKQLPSCADFNGAYEWETQIPNTTP